MRHVIVGVDGSAAGAAALQWAAQLAVGAGAEVVAVSAFREHQSEITPGDHEQYRTEHSRQLNDAWIRPATDAGAKVRTIAGEGDPRDVVPALAEAEDADLIVLGRTGAGGGPGFLHLGSVVEHVAHHARRPLAVIPSTTPGAIERIVVGVDGSAESAHAVDWCAEVAKICDASVVAITVHEPYLEWTPSSSPDNWRRKMEEQIDDWTAPITSAGITVDRIAKRDLHPADGLLAAASAAGGDVLVIGTRGAGGFLGLRTGGVAMKVVHRASMPVVLVPPRAGT